MSLRLNLYITLGFLTGLLAVLLSVLFAPTVHATGTSYAPDCTLEPKKDRIIIELGSLETWRGPATINSNGSQRDAYYMTRTTVPAGTYKVTLQSWDEHSHSDSNQTKEQWYLRFWTASHTHLASTKSISDIPSNKDYWTQVVEDTFEVPHGVGIVKGWHTHYRNSKSNSLVPVCAALDKVTTSVPDYPTCPLTQKSGRTIVNFMADKPTSQQALLAHASESASRYSVNANLSSGTYDVTFASYDDHTGKNNGPQPEEQWYLALYDSGGSEITTTNSISDLPDDEDYLTEEVQKSLDVTSDVTKFKAKHTVYKDSNPNSIVPLCAAFDEIICDAPNVPSIVSKNATVGTNFSYTINVTNGTGATNLSLDASQLPDGMTFDGTKISGTPTTPGTYVIYITASNSCGDDTMKLKIKVVDVPVCDLPNVADIVTRDTTVGNNFTYIVDVVDGTGATTLTVDTSTLPSGMTFDGSKISGTPTQAGTYEIKITATNQCGNDKQVLTLKVDDPPVCDAPTTPTLVTRDASVGNNFSYTIDVTEGSDPATITLDTSKLPDGLSFDGSKISGTPTSDGTYEIIVTATNSCGSDDLKLVIEVKDNPQCDAPELPNLVSQNLTIGDSYAYVIPVTDGTGDTSLTLNTSDLPPGLTFDGRVIRGEGLKVGSYAVTVTASNECGSDDLIIQFDVEDEKDECTKPNVVLPRSKQGMVGEYFKYEIDVLGGSVDEIEVRNLPDGLTFDGRDEIEGTPTEAGTFEVIVFAENDCGSDTEDFEIIIDEKEDECKVSDDINILSPGTQFLKVGEPLDYTIQTSGGDAERYFAIDLPNGLSLSGDRITGSLSFPGTYRVGVSALNDCGMDTVYFDIIVTTVAAVSLVAVPETGAAVGLTTAQNTLFAVGTMALAIGFASLGLFALSRRRSYATVKTRKK